VKILLLNEAFVVLKHAGLVKTESEFCQEFIGASEGYIRQLRFKKTEPSVRSIAVLGSRLQKAGEQMLSSPHYRPLGLKFIALSERCHSEVNAEGVELDLAG
jgi:hypothetical protein